MIDVDISVSHSGELFKKINVLLKGLLLLTSETRYFWEIMLVQLTLIISSSSINDRKKKKRKKESKTKPEIERSRRCEVTPVRLPFT